MGAAASFGPGVWSPAWIVLVMLGALLLLIVGSIALAVLLGLWTRRSRARDDSQRAPDQR
jgi:hypothetical protein